MSNSRQRAGLSKRARFAVLMRDGFRCVYCGAGAPDVQLQVDHVIAHAKRGANASSNYASACSDCNGGKSDSDLTTLPPVLEDRQGAQMLAEIFEIDPEDVQAIDALVDLIHATDAAVDASRNERAHA